MNHISTTSRIVHLADITGGIAHSNRLTQDLETYVGSLAKYHVFPGESEMEALAEGFYRVYDGEEEILEYPGE